MPEDCPRDGGRAGAGAVMKGGGRAVAIAKGPPRVREKKII